MSLTVVYILVAILLFGLLVLVHEFGHFLTAKLSGVQVNEFSLFMGPAIWKKQKGETLYSLRCIPIGGYCAMEGEDGDSDNPRAFGRAKVWKRLIILVAGSFMNLVAGLLIMTIYVASVYQAIPTRAVASVDSASVFAGQLQAGDSFYSIGGEHVYTSGDVTMLLDRCEGGTADIVVLRGGEKVRLPNAQVERRDFGGIHKFGVLVVVIVPDTEFVPQGANQIGSVLLGGFGVDQSVIVTGLCVCDSGHDHALTHVVRAVENDDLILPHALYVGVVTLSCE